MLTDFRERGRDEERERVRNSDAKKQLLVASHHDWGRTHNPGSCPDWRSQLQPFNLLGDAPAN